MSLSTRVFLAVVAAVVVILVLYYGVFTNNATPAVSRAVNGAEHALARPREVEIAPPATQPRLADPVRISRPGDIPPPVVDSSLAAPDDGRRTAVPALEEHAPVIVDAGEFGGKDAPPPPALEKPADPPAKEAGQDKEPQRAPSLTRRPAPQPPAPQPPPTTEYTVKPGDTMTSIAQEWFGDSSKWDLIARANPLIDPSRLDVGQVLRLPPRDAQREEGGERAGASPIVYVVRSGDSLSRIARTHYGHERHWRLIYDANRPVIGINPNNLRVGMRLTIPPAPKPAPEN